MNTYTIGPKESNHILTGGNVISDGGPAQIAVECMISGCCETIAIHPVSNHPTMSRNQIVDSISDSRAAEIFKSKGWNVEFGKSILCPKHLNQKP